MDDLMRYVALRSFQYDGQEYAVGDLLPVGGDPQPLRHMLRVGLIERSIPPELGGKLAGAMMARARHSRKEKAHVEPEDE